MRALAEGENAGRTAMDVEAVGIRELLGIAIGRAEEEKHPLTLPEHLSADFDVAAQGSREKIGGHLVARDLLEGIRDPGGVFAECATLLGVA